MAAPSTFSPEFHQVLAFSQEEARRKGYTEVNSLHLLMGILHAGDKKLEHVFDQFRLNQPELMFEIDQQLPPAEGSVPEDKESIPMSEKSTQLMKLAVLEARLQRKTLVDPIDLLLAMLHDQMDNSAKKNLEQKGLCYDNMLNAVSEYAGGGTSAEPSVQDTFGDSDDDEDEDDALEPRQRRKAMASTAADGPKFKAQKGKTPIIDNFGTDLTAAAAEGKLDPIVGRTREIQRLTEILCRRKKNNPVLIGEPGVGKSAIVEGLAQLIADHRTSPALFRKRIVSVDLTSIVAGTKYRGQFEERMKQLMKELESNPDIIIFIDEIHTMIGAGAASGSMDAANILKPALARGQVQCIGATTLDEYRQSIEKDGALERRFQKIIVEPSTAEETLAILGNIKSRYEEHHCVTYTSEAIEACVALTERYVTDRSLPDKAIDALDEAGSRVHLREFGEMPQEITDKEKVIGIIKEKKFKAVNDQQFELAAGFRDRQVELEAELEELQQKWREEAASHAGTVTAEDVADVVAMMSGVPATRMAESEMKRLRTMAGVLNSEVIGQERAVNKVVKSIQLSRTGLKDPRRPIGVFMFLGPTGVGKTYLAKRLAEQVFGSEDAIIRVDMSEYSESHNTSRLVGAPPGYVGYEEGGQLTEKVRRRPYSIVLLDEIEKAHGNVFNMLLQVMDEGRLTDGNGRLVNFSNTIIIMTSNAGTRQLKEFGHGVGFTAGGNGLSALSDKDREYARSVIQKSLEKQFAPEFLNRLDDIITFDQLDLDSIKKIVSIEMKPLKKRIEDMGYSLELTDEARSFLAEKGYDIQYGARPLRRAIQTYMEEPICNLLLDEAITPGATITATHEEGKEELTLTV